MHDARGRLWLGNLGVFPAALLLLVFVTAMICVSVLSLAFMTDTEYAPGYDENAFRAIKPGDPVDSVIQSLGEPFRKSRVNVPQRWHYEELNLSFIVDKEDRVFDYDDPDGVLDQIKSTAPSSTELREILGPASSYSPATNRECWSYSRSASGNSNYWQRDIVIDRDTNTVMEKDTSLYRD